MQRIGQYILKLDRRIIYVLVVLCVLLPIFFPLGLPFSVTPEVQVCYDDVKKLKAGEAILISCDYGPDSFPECQPMLVALLHQCFKQKLRPILVALTPTGDVMAQKGLEQVLGSVDGQTNQPVYPDLVAGRDYVLLGYQAGSNAIIIALTTSFTNTYKKDKDDQATADLEIFRDVRKLGDVKYIVDIAAVALPEQWLIFGAGKENIPMSVCCTAVSAAQYYPYYHAGQFRGLIGGMKGSAEYEKLVDVAGITGEIPNATKGMDSQSLVHVFIVLAIVVVNIFYFFERRREAAQGRHS
jgi:hypothetical protein